MASKLRPTPTGSQSGSILHALSIASWGTHYHAGVRSWIRARALAVSEKGCTRPDAESSVVDVLSVEVRCELSISTNYDVV